MTAMATEVASIKLVSDLIETGHVDTVYRDVYLERAQTRTSCWHGSQRSDVTEWSRGDHPSGGSSRHPLP
jgi:hypothetical protein